MKKIRALLAVLGILILVGGAFLLRGRTKTEGPQQPIAYDHWQHVTKPDGPKLDCTDCHENADKSSHATIPNTSTCMLCHAALKTESPEVQKLAAFAQRGEQPPWVRVYWQEPGSDVFFSHKPHIRAKVECTTCHGPVPEMHRMRRAVNQTMGWCIDCHRQRGASVDCYVCHR
jgi:hypothetical protein